MAERDSTTLGEKEGTMFTLSLDEVDEINLRLSEAMSMVEVLSNAALQGDEMKRLHTFALLLEEKLEEAKEKFNRATSKEEAAAQGGE